MSKGNLKPALETFQTYYTPSPMITDLLKVSSHLQCYLQRITDTQKQIIGYKAVRQQAARTRSLASVPLQLKLVF